MKAYIKNKTKYKEIEIFCYPKIDSSYYFSKQAPTTHPAGLVIEGQAVMEPEEGLPLIDFFKTKEEVEVQVI